MSEQNFLDCAQDLLLKQHALSSQLLSLLTQEYKTLSTSEAKSLGKITLGKQPLVFELNQLNQQWLTLLATHYSDMSPDETRVFLNDYDQANASQLLTLWENLQQSAKDCQKANTINGSVIALRHQAAQQTMAILRGQIPGDTIYDTHGNNTPGYARGSTIASA